MNTILHSLPVIQAFFAKQGIPVVHQSTYSPGIAPCDFSKFKASLKYMFSKQRRDKKNRPGDGGTGNYLIEFADENLGLSKSRFAY